MDDKPICPRCDKEGKEPHPCPYQQEINDSDSPCTCCDKCTQECAWDI